jgi:uncharacterized OsmC-like protein
LAGSNKGLGDDAYALDALCHDAYWPFETPISICSEIRKMNSYDGHLEFGVKLRWDGETGGEVDIGRFPALKLDMPIRFGGKSRYPCPDELFLSSVAGCLLTTFLYFKSKLHVQLERFEISISGSLDTELEGHRMAGIEAIIHVEAKKIDEINVRRCIELTKKYCHITRTLEKVMSIKIVEKMNVVAQSNGH